MSKIQTVLGEIDSADMGFTLAHEHLFTDMASLAPEEMREKLRALNKESVEDAISELALYEQAGGGTLIDVTPTGIGIPNMYEKMAEASRKSGIHIVCGVAYYTVNAWTEAQRAMSVEEIADEYISCIVNGFGGSSVKPGVIGEIGISWPMNEVEERSLRAAAIASLETGLSISVHPGFDESSPPEIVKILTEAGVNPEKIIIGHMASTFAPDRRDDLSAFASLGTYFAFDQFSTPQRNFDAIGRAYWSDEDEIDAIAFLEKQGYEDKILISCDLFYSISTVKGGGVGYLHIPNTVVPMMRARGVSEAAIRAITIENPAKAFAVGAL